MSRWTDLVEHRLPELGLEPARREVVVEELASQLEDVYEEARARGLGESEALAEALRQVPDWQALARSVAGASRKEPVMVVRLRESKLGSLLRDLRYGARVMLQRPGFSALAILALALGIGANTVAFTFVKSMLLGGLPVKEPERLVRIYSKLSGFDYASVSYPDYEAIRSAGPFFESVLAEKLVPLNLGREQGNERIWGYAVSGNYFRVLGLRPALGRFFDFDGLEPGQHPEVVLSYGFWQRAFAGSPDALGETILVNGFPFTVVGVAAEDFTGTNVGLAPSLWAPVAMYEQLIPGLDILVRRNRSFLSLARLAKGVEVEEARRGISVVADRLAAEYPDANKGIGFTLLPESEGGIHPIMRGGFVGFSGILVTVVVLVLLLACANVAGLLLVRGLQRRKEVSLRLALGATRGRLVRQLLAESVLLSIAAGTAGLLLGALALHVLSSLKPPTDVPLFLPLALDGRVLGFTLVLTLATGIVFGLVPALQASRLDLAPAMKESPGASVARRSPLRSVLVAGQIALSTVLLVGTGLFLRSLANAQSIDLGFEPRGVVMSSVDLALQGYDTEKGRLFFRELRSRLEALPGVTSVGWANMIPFDFNINQWELAPEGYEPPPSGAIPSIDRNVVSPGYFRTMETPILDGREFDERDGPDSTKVVVVNEALAERFWPGERAVGKRLGRPGGTMYEVIGVVATGKYLTLGEDPKPFVFLPFLQSRNLDMTFVVRAKADPAGLLERIREEVRALDPGLPLYNVKTLEDHLTISLAPARAGAWILGSFGLLALVLASIGLYGVVAFRVAERTSEIGIRRALGAEPGDVFRGVLASGMALAAPGLLIGLVLSVLASRLAVSLLYGMSPLDPVAFGAAFLVLVATALAASAIPARRALRVDPIVALRYE